MSIEKKIPVIILTGGLGAGKTTLLNNILADRAKAKTRFAIIENEFGEIGIDQELIDLKSAPTVVEMADGCICCTVRNDLVEALSELHKRKNDFHILIIETTGLAEPGPVAQVIIAHSELRDKYELKAVVSLLDAEYVLKQLEITEITASQIGFADFLVLNKIDRVDEKDIQIIIERLSSINAQASIILSEYAKINIETIFTADAYSIEKALELDPSFLENDNDGKDSDNFMGLLDRLPSYRDEISSVGIVLPGDLDEKKLECWLTYLTSFHGEDLLRMKGILSISGMEERFVIQGVHSTLTATSTAPWGDAVRENRFLVIGRFLDRSMIEDGFRQCLVP